MGKRKTVEKKSEVIRDVVQQVTAQVQEPWRPRWQLVADCNANGVGNIARLQTKGIFGGGVLKATRFIVSSGIKQGRCTGHTYSGTLREARAKYEPGEDHIYDSVLRCRVR